MGFNRPFAGLLPHSGGHVMLASHNAPGTPLCFRSAFLPVRAHLPFVPLRPPRLIFVGVTDRLLELQDLQKRPAGDADGVDFWALTPVCDPFLRRTFGRGNDPALGFASCRVVGHVAVHRPGSTPCPITSLRNADGNSFTAERFLSAHGLGDDPSHHAQKLRARAARAVPSVVIAKY
jgi:hypothetical protein